MFFSDVYPDYTFEILVDLTLINKGSLLEDMDSPVSSPHETQEHADQKSPKHGRCADFILHRNSHLSITDLRDELIAVQYSVLKLFNI